MAPTHRDFPALSLLLGRLSRTLDELLYQIVKPSLTPAVRTACRRDELLREASIYTPKPNISEAERSRSKKQSTMACI